MRQIYKKRNRGKHKFGRIVFFGVVCSFFFFLLLVFFYSLLVLDKKKMFVSPIPKQNTEQQTENINTLSELLKAKHLAFSAVFPFDTTSYLVKLTSGEEVFFTNGKSLAKQVSSLQLALSRLTIEGKRVSRIDFRFNTPVLTMK